MTDIAIRAENLSKRYTVTADTRRHDTLGDRLTCGLKSLLCRRGRPESEERKFWALQDVSFEVREGEIVGLIGHNGAGKSTLLKLLSRVTVPTSGRAEMYGRVGSLLEVGTGFHPELTGRENIYLNGAVIGMKREEIRRQFDEIVEFSEIGDFLDTPVKRYSSGMYVRLAFAVAAHLDPEILLVDEVLAVGDIAFQKKCLGKIGSVARSGRTVVFISHNMTAVNSLCQRVIWVQGGRLIDDGPSADVVTRYLAASSNTADISEEVWNCSDDAPGNDIVRLRRIGVRPRAGLTSDPLTMETPFQVEVEYWNLHAGSHLHITIHLYTADGLIAFTTGSHASGPMPEGLYRSVGYFPGNLLNSGTHRFVVLVVKNTSSIILSYESRVPITVIDVRQRSGNFYGKEPGVVQPLLEWSTDLVSFPESAAGVSGFAHADYARSLAEFGSPRKLPQCGGWILERQIPSTSYRDAMGCYPLFACADWTKLKSDLEMLENDLVSIALVTDPFGTCSRDELSGSFHTVIPFKEHFVADLTLPVSSIVSSHHRKYARKALRSVTVDICEEPIRHLDEWSDLYGSLCKRFDVDGVRAFSRNAFRMQLSIPGAVMFRALHHGTAVTAHLVYMHNDVCYGHLVGSTPEGQELLASYALYWTEIEFFSGKARWFDWGGVAGRTDEKTDGLARFKRGWSTETRTSFFCGRILNQQLYDDILAASAVEPTDYFPAYRNGEFC